MHGVSGGISFYTESVNDFIVYEGGEKYEHRY